MSTAPGKTVVLIIEDEVQMRRLIRACLLRNNYEVLEAATGEEGLASAVHSQPGIIILDLGLPDIDGMSVLSQIREWSTIPVIVLSVRDRDIDKVSALDSGANDYLAKPFSTSELLARLRVMQRHHQPVEEKPVFVSGHLQVDLAAHLVKVRDQPVNLTKTEYELLRYLVQHSGRALTHRQILREIWNSDDVEKTGSLRMHVTSLREKIEINPARPELLATIPGVGYRLEAAKETIFVSGHLEVDWVARVVKVRGQAVNLARTEYELLHYFVRNAGRALTHSQILREIWDLDDVNKMGRLRVYVTYLREKIEIDPAKPRLLITIPGVGYRLDIKE